jgi:uncharacterized DUF497 family protein
MDFDWDAAKATTNRRKHGVSFEEAKGVVRHPLAITVDDLAHSRAENREKTIGPSTNGRVLIVIHMKRSNALIRIISAEEQTAARL